MAAAREAGDRHSSWKEEGDGGVSVAALPDCLTPMCADFCDLRLYLGPSRPPCNIRCNTCNTCWREVLQEVLQVVMLVYQAKRRKKKTL